MDPNGAMNKDEIRLRIKFQNHSGSSSSNSGGSIIYEINLDRYTAFEDLSMILIETYSDSLLRMMIQQGGSRTSQEQEIDPNTLLFFRDSDNKQVGMCPYQLIASPDSNFVPDRDILLVRIPPPAEQQQEEPEDLTKSPSLEDISQERMMSDPDRSDPRSSRAMNTPPPPRRPQDDPLSKPSSYSSFVPMDEVQDSKTATILSHPRENGPPSSGKSIPSPRDVCVSQSDTATNPFTPNSFAQMNEAQNSSIRLDPLYPTKSDPPKPTAPPPPRPPQNDSSGKLIAQGSLSQYSLDGGQSACTAVCVVAAVRILSTVGESIFELMSSPVKLDAWVLEGVKLYRALAGTDPSRSCHDHASMDDIFDAAAFRDIGKHVRRGIPYQGTVENRGSLIDAFQAAVDFGDGQSRLAITLTKSGETVLCMADCTDTEYRWFLFDSHGQSHEQKKLSYCKEYSSFHRLLDAYQAKYPFQDFRDDYSLQSAMYNLFEAVPIVLDSFPPTIDSSTPMAVPSSQGVEIPVENIPQSPGPTTSTASPALREILDRSQYECVISSEIMADPVVASDGHVYDRPQIEMHFAVRRAAETERIAREESRDNGNPAPADNDATCCDGPRPEIELTSPITGLKVLETLTPVLFLERMIVGLVNANALGMTEEEVIDWHERRQEKKVRDTERRAQQEKAAAEEEERRRFDAEAERRYRNRPPPVPVEPSQRVQVVRDIDNASESLGEHDLGICVALGDRSAPVYANTLYQRVRRCMVGCCAIPLTSSTCCDRCQRPVCSDCLRFGVSSFNPQGTGEHSNTLHHVCFECVTQIVDAMDSNDAVSNQRSAVILRRLEGHLALLTNRLSTKQDTVIRREMYDEASPRLDEIRGAIGSSRSELNRLKEAVRREQQRANEASADDGGPGVGQLLEQLANVKSQWDALLQADSPDDEEELFRYVCRKSELADEHDRLSLMLEEAVRREEQRAREAAANDGGSRNPDRELTVAEISEQLESVGRQWETFLQADEPEDEEELLRYVCRKSELSDEYERLSSLLERVSAERGGSASTTATLETDMATLVHLRERLLELQEQTAAAGSYEEQTARIVEFSEVAARLEELELSISMAESTAGSAIPSRQSVGRTGLQQSSRLAGAEGPQGPVSEEVPDIETADQARSDIAAVGVRLESWPLPLGLQYPTQRMERQLETLRSTLRLRGVESRRAFEALLNIQSNQLIQRREALEDEVAETSRLLRDAQTNAEEAVAQREARDERRRQEEAARLAREAALREEERRAREAAEALRRQHVADEEATNAAFARAGAEDGGRAFGMKGDARMCGRCKTGPLYNERCADLAAHNDSYRDNEGRLRRANECPNPDCRWYNPHWHQWPYWDGIFGPH